MKHLKSGKGKSRRLDTDELLGTDTDAEIARTIGWTEADVRRRRIRYRIRAFQGPRQPYFWSDEEIALLGTMSDKAVAKNLRRDQSAVNRKRRKLGIFPPAEIHLETGQLLRIHCNA